MAKKKNEEYSDDDQGYGDEPNFDDPKGFVDDVSDEGTSKNLTCWQRNHIFHNHTLTPCFIYIYYAYVVALICV